jgi:hypothetical protein
MIFQDAIVTRLTAQVGTRLKGVGKTSSLIDALGKFTGGPRAFVLPAARRPSPNDTGTQVVRQRVVETYTVLLAFSRRGELFDAMGETSDAVIAALLGWQPEGATGVFEYAGGGMLPVDLNEGVIFWGDNFAINSQLRSI